MTMIKIKGRLGLVDVSSKKCANRPCLHVHEDKGTFTPGVGYTSYHAKPRLVCMTRHQFGCPQNSVCAKCRTVSVDASGVPCDRYGCDGLTVDLTPRNEVKP